MTPRAAEQDCQMNDEVLAGFVVRKGEIDAMPARIRSLSDEHCGVAPDEVT